MGQKVSPVSFRLGFSRKWDSLWYANHKVFADQLLEDVKIRRHIKDNFKQCAISRVFIERASEKIRVNIYTARPGVIIGRKGADIDRLRDDLVKLCGKELKIEIHEVKHPALSAQLVAENVALQLEKRIAFRRAMKKSIQQTMDAGAKGIKIMVKGRLGGAEIARSEWYRVGAVPLQTMRADIDYGFAEAKTTYGVIGVKTWINRGEFIERPNLYKREEREEKPREKHPVPKEARQEAGPKEAVKEGALGVGIHMGPSETVDLRTEIKEKGELLAPEADLGDPKKALDEKPPAKTEGS